MKKTVFFVVTFLFIVLVADANAATRNYARDFVSYFGSGKLTIDVTNKIVLKITVNSGHVLFSNFPANIVQNGIQYSWYLKKYYTPRFGENIIGVEFQNFDGMSDIYPGVTATITMDVFPSSFNIWGSFRINFGVWENNDYFDVEADPNPPSGPCPAQKVLGVDNPDIENLRVFRDSKLAQSAVGRRIIEIYYTNADSINAALDNSPALRALTRGMLEVIAPMVGGRK